MKLSKSWLNILIFSISFILVCFSTQSNIEEDSIYVNQVNSFITDFDFDISDQVEPEFNYILTKKLTHPSHHSVNQSSSILLSLGLFKFITFIFDSNRIEAFRLALMFLSFFNIITGFLILKKALNNHLKFNINDAILFILASPFFYYSFISLSTLEVFLFPFSSLLVFFLFQRNTKMTVFTSFCFGLTSSILLTSKGSFFPIVFCLSVYLYLKKSYNFSYFLFGLISPIIIKLVHTYSIYGDIVFVNGVIGKIVTDFSWNNITETILYGFFTFNGVLGSFPLIFALVILLLAKVLEKPNNRKSFDLFFYFFWIMIGLFQTFFLIGPYLEDHFYGRHLMIAMPPIFILYLELKKKIGDKKHFALMSILVTFSLYKTLSFCTQYKLAHYNYASKKYITEIEPLLKQLQQISNNIFHIIQNNILTLVVLALVYFILFKIFILIKSRFGVIKLFQYYQVMITGILLLLVGISAYNLSLRIPNYNQKKFSNTIITDNPYFYPFTYVMDFFRSQYIATKRQTTRLNINNKREKYYKMIKNTAIQQNIDFEDALHDLNYNIDYYYKTSSRGEN